MRPYVRNQITRVYCLQIKNCIFRDEHRNVLFFSKLARCVHKKCYLTFLICKIALKVVNIQNKFDYFQAMRSAHLFFSTLLRIFISL